MGKWPKKVAKWSVLFQKWAAESRCGSKGFGLSGQMATFISYLIEKSEKYIINRKNIWPNGQRGKGGLPYGNMETDR